MKHKIKVYYTSSLNYQTARKWGIKINEEYKEIFTEITDIESKRYNVLISEDVKFDVSQTYKNEYKLVIFDNNEVVFNRCFK